MHVVGSSDEIAASGEEKTSGLELLGAQLSLSILFMMYHCCAIESRLFQVQ